MQNASKVSSDVKDIGTDSSDVENIDTDTEKLFGI
jgi:hypothetical protein